MKEVFLNVDNLKKDDIDEEVIRVKGLIINSKKDASRMSVIIDIAINVNKMNQKEVKC